MVTNGSDIPFGSFGSNSMASIISTFNRISGGVFNRANSNSSLCFSLLIYNMHT